MVEKKCIIKKDYANIGVITGDDIPLNKQINFPKLTIIIRCVFQKCKELFPQIYLDECLYQS